MGEVMEAIEKDFVNKFLSGKFKKAAPLLDEISKEKLHDLLISTACDKGSLAVYAFICYLIYEDETINLHLLAFTLLNIGLCHLEGAYQASLSHLRRAEYLDPYDIIVKDSLLFLYAVPDRVVSDEEARRVIHEMLEKQPDNAAALYTLKELERGPWAGEKKVHATIKEAVMAGEFIEAKERMPVFLLDALRTMLFEVAQSNENICAYAFINFLMLVEGESRAYHQLASELLKKAYPSLTGNAETALYHDLRALELGSV